MGNWADILRQLPAIAEEVPVDRVPAAMASLSSAMGMLAARAMTAPTDDSSRSIERRVSLAGLAKHLDLGESTVRRMVFNGEFEEGAHYARIGKRLLFDLAAVEQKLKNKSPRRVNPSDDGAIPFMRKERRRGQNS